MAYIDGFIVPVPRNRIEEYRAIATLAAAVWREHGALEYKEFIAEDVNPGEVTSFPQSVKLEPGEVVFLSWVVFESRAQRDRVNAKVRSDPRMQSDPAEMPFDGKRMIYGGFETFVEA